MFGFQPIMKRLNSLELLENSSYFFESVRSSAVMRSETRASRISPNFRYQKDGLQVARRTGRSCKK
jgi:hypothetical protein